MLQGMMKGFFILILILVAVGAVKAAFHSVFAPSPVAVTSAPPPSVPVITPH